jgi:hypothetical protein
MKEIDGKKFPTVWSEIFLDPNDILGTEKMDADPGISIVDVIDWIDEYRKLEAEASMDAIDLLLQRGNILLDYLPTIKARVNCAYKLYKLESSTWESKTMSSYSSPAGTKELSEKSRERMILLEDDYVLRQNGVIRMETMSVWCDDMMRSLRDNIMELSLRLKKKIATFAEQPTYTTKPGSQAQ